MIDEDLEALWRKLQLTEEEEEGVIMPKEIFYESPIWSPNCLLGSLLTKKGFNREAFKSTMEKVWRETPLKRITEVGENLFLFQFRSADDCQIVINGGPWNFDDRLVLLKPLEKGDKPGRDILFMAEFWLQIYNLPFMSMSDAVGKFIGAKLGQVKEVRTDEEGIGLGSCLLVRVDLDTRKALKRRLKITIDEESLMVDFKYERLPALCYGCGIMGHNGRVCAYSIRMKKEQPDWTAQYGAWIRAPIKQRDSQLHNRNKEFVEERNKDAIFPLD